MLWWKEWQGCFYFSSVVSLDMLWSKLKKNANQKVVVDKFWGQLRLCVSVKSTKRKQAAFSRQIHDGLVESTFSDTEQQISLKYSFSHYWHICLNYFSVFWYFILIPDFFLSLHMMSSHTKPVMLWRQVSPLYLEALWYINHFKVISVRKINKFFNRLRFLWSPKRATAVIMAH